MIGALKSELIIFSDYKRMLHWLYQVFACWVIFQIMCCLLIYFKINAFKTLILGKPSECETVWIQIRPDVSSGLVWVHTI